MAKLRHTHLFNFANFKTGTSKTVGNTRTVEHVQYGFTDEITGKLHGHPVVRLKRFVQGEEHFYTVEADTCGYTTATTRQAVVDFLQVAGFRANASIAEGQFRVWLIGPDNDRFELPFRKSARHGQQLVGFDFSPKDWAYLTGDLVN